MASNPVYSLPNIEDIVLDFSKAQKVQPFHMKDLTDYVLSQCMVAPDSPGRILRSLKKRGYVDYTLLSRSKSLYQFV